MTDRGVSRRKVLSGIAAAGGTGAVVGGSTASLFTDEETFGNDSIEASTSVAGTVDIEIAADAFEDGTGMTYSVTLPDDGTNNPAYVWVRTLVCPEPVELAARLTVELRVECGGSETVLATGSLLEVLDGLRDGELLRCEAGESCLEPGGTRDLVLDVTDVEESDTGSDGSLEFELEFYGRQCRYTDPANPFTDADVVDTCDPAQAISFLAFCSTESDASLDPETATVNATDSSDDPTSIDWRTGSDVDYVVVKAGQNFKIYDHSGADGTTAGTATSTRSGAAYFGPVGQVDCKSGQPESCPGQAAVKTVGDGGTFDGTVVKLEYVSSTGTFQREEDEDNE